MAHSFRQVRLAKRRAPNKANTVMHATVHYSASCLTIGFDRCITDITTAGDDELSAIAGNLLSVLLGLA